MITGPRIQIPQTAGSVLQRAFQLRPELADGPTRMSQAVFEHSILPLRIREAARMRIAEINGCMVCQNFIDPKLAAEGIDQAFYDNVSKYDEVDLYSPDEVLAIRLAEAFSLEWADPSEELFDELADHFSDPELLDLMFCIARHVAFGRLVHMLGLDLECEYTFGFNLSTDYDPARAASADEPGLPEVAALAHPS